MKSNVSYRRRGVRLRPARELSGLDSAILSSRVRDQFRKDPAEAARVPALLGSHPRAWVDMARSTNVSVFAVLARSKGYWCPVGLFGYSKPAPGGVTHAEPTYWLWKPARKGMARLAASLLADAIFDEGIHGLQRGETAHPNKAKMDRHFAAIQSRLAALNAGRASIRRG